MESPTGNYISKGEIHINEPSICFVCQKSDLDAHQKYCSSCGFPQNGESTERMSFYRDHLMKKNEFNDAVQNLKSAQTTLFVSGGLGLLLGLLAGILEPEAAIECFVFGFGLVAIYTGLGFWAKQNPLGATITGLAIFITIWVLLIAVSIYANEVPPIGIIPVVIIVLLAKGMFSALKAERLRKEKGWDWRTNM